MCHFVFFSFPCNALLMWHETKRTCNFLFVRFSSKISLNLLCKIIYLTKMSVYFGRTCCYSEFFQKIHGVFLSGFFSVFCVAWFNCQYIVLRSSWAWNHIPKLKLNLFFSGFFIFKPNNCMYRISAYSFCPWIVFTLK